MRGLTKKKFKIIIVSAGIFAVAAVIYLLFFKWSDYEYYKTYTTDDKAHNIVLYSSVTPSFSLLPGERTKFKMVCEENSSGRKVEYTEFIFKPCKGCGCSLKNDDGQKCTFGVSDCSGYRSFDIVWSEIFT
ncbi:MAG: hypothetical protein HDT43_01290 [Ruminococcaceae bacterium]|nr:hypothetical protein [Oscillospiraceae bacterium]